MTPAAIADELRAIQARVDALVERIVSDVPTPPVALVTSRRRHDARVERVRDVGASVAIILAQLPARAEALASTPTEDRRVA